MHDLMHRDKGPFLAGLLQHQHQLQCRCRAHIKLPWRLHQHQRCHLHHRQSLQHSLRHPSHADTTLRSTRIALRADITRPDVPIVRTPPHPAIKRRNNAEPI